LTGPERIAELKQENAQLQAQVAELQQQLDWFKRQLFGAKSEKRLDVHPAVQGNLLAALGVAAPPPPPAPTETITYQRRPKTRDAALNDTGLRFGEDVPREVIAVSDPAIEAIPEERRVRIGEKITYRLAQRPGSYVILEYVRPVYKVLDDLSILTTPAPANVLEKSGADVSFLAGMLVDKFCYHLPLYRQHQRLLQSGIQLSRSTLTTWAGRAIDLLRPIVDAQAEHLLQSRELAIDEVPIKAGHQGKGKLRQVYFWRIPRWRSTPTTSSVPCAPFPWAERTGCLPGRRSVPNASASSKACWCPVVSRGWTPIPTWSTYCSASACIRPTASASSRRGSGRRGAPAIP